MKVATILQPTAVVPALRGRDVQSILAELSAPIAQAAGLEVEDLVEVLLAREGQGSTGVGNGVALPHARHPRIGTLVASFGRSRKGVPFGSADGGAVHLFFALFAPEDLAGDFLKALALASRMLRESSIREALREAEDARAIYEVLTAPG